MPQPPRECGAEEAPPFLGTWRRVYVAVLIYLVAVIAVSYLFTRAYR